MKGATLRPAAERDLVDAARACVGQGGPALGKRMFDTAVAGLKPLQRTPSAGCPKLGALCEVPGLRSSRVTGFAFHWLYFEAGDQLDVVRLLADEQLVLWLQEQDVAADGATARP